MRDFHRASGPTSACSPLCALLALAVLTGVPGSRTLAADDAPLVLQGARVYQSPTEDPVDKAVVLIENGHITAVSKPGALPIPRSARVIDCAGKVIVAGFWNSHVHFENGWQGASQMPAAALDAHLQEMLTGFGFTTVWDLGSDPANTVALRRRIESGELAGPEILMAGAIFPQHGHPVYLPAEMQLPEAADPQQATRLATQYMRMGLEGIKLFTGAFMGDKPVVNMDTAIVRAAAHVAHAEGKPVFAHPQNTTGVDNALAGGVNVLAHTIPNEGRFTGEELSRMRRQHTALIPTLTLWTTVVNDPAVADRLVDAGVSELHAYASTGGTILFGTDVGFISKYDTTREFAFMGRAMSWRAILASLTTNPSAFFKQANKGTVAKGMSADLVVLDADPATDVRNFAKVAYTIRAGKIIFQRNGKAEKHD